jgi:hypothetical protein
LVEGRRIQDSGFRIQDSGGRRQEKHLWNPPPGPPKVSNCFAPLDSMSVGKGQTKNMEISKKHEQFGNVYENKGLAFHGPL